MTQNYDPEFQDETGHGAGILEQVKALDGRSIVVGAVVGVIVGLLIGWVIWPVQWSNAWPSDLSQEAKAQYIASVAQVYAYYPDESAEETARMRLYDLNDDLAGEIAAAQAYFDSSSQVNARIYINDLANLAQGLGVNSADIMQVQPNVDETGAAVESQDDGAGGRTWIRWFFSILLIIVLIGGGIYILSRMARGGDSTRDFGDDGQDPYDDVLGVGGSSYGGQGDYSFERDPDEDILYPAGVPVVEGQTYDDDEYFDESSVSIAQQEQASAYYPPKPPVAPAAAKTSVHAPYPKEPPITAGKALNTFLVNYRAGVIDYEESFAISDPATNEYIGECGMGVNVKNGILNDNPDSVVALDVWLYDKKQEKAKANQTRVLLSEYAVDHNLEPAFVRQMPDAPAPVVAQPGLSFQLIGADLVLDCEVLEADYLSEGETEGVFRNLKLELTIRSRK